MSPIRVALLAFLVPLAVAAQTVPHTVPLTGRLTSAGAPQPGAHQFTFALYDVATGGTALWTEQQADLVVSDDGMVFTQLGTVTPLELTVVDGRELFLGVSIDGAAELAPRLAVGSVPYALRAEAALVAAKLGTLSPSDVVTGVTAGSGVSATRNGGEVTLSADTGTVQARISGNCAPGEAIIAVNADGSVVCSTINAVTDVSATAPLQSSGGTTPTLSLPPASSTADGYLAATDFAAFAAKVSSVGATAGSGVEVSGTATAPTVGLTTGCSTGQFLAWSGTGWQCTDVPAPAPSALTNMMVFSSNGSFTVPAGVTKVKVEVWGGGGGGSSTTTNGQTGGGGGAGGYAKSIVTVTPGQVFAVTVGAGGTAGPPTTAAGSVAGAGGSSSFGAVVSATGGTGASAHYGQAVQGLGGAGTGQFTVTGGDGRPGESGFGSGVGSPGGTAGGGGGTGGMGGRSYLCTTNSCTYDYASGTGRPGNAPGGGGGGAVSASGSPPGGAGAPGRVVVFY